ncbi:MAG: [protein-PII] uridylyltransferase [Rhodospirillaceae bacterium]|nr:[protein-PII] uridylyltransferase [Rhodospirillaceae bacterium]
MDELKGHRAIIDRPGLQEAAAALVDKHGTEDAGRTALLDLYKAQVQRGYDELERRFMDDQNGALAVKGHCFLIDQLIRVIYDVAATYFYPAPNPTAADQLCITAFGGYGRGELAPKSDLDLLFVLPYKQTPRGEQLVEFILYTLWDLSFKVGHATRSIDENIRQAKDDITIRTGLLESRYVWGEEALYRELRERFFEDVVEGTGPDFVEAKLAERDERHDKLGNSRYVLEPNIKDGKGGLRDLQTLFWIAKYLYKVTDVGRLVDEKVLTAREVRRFDKAQLFLWTLRCNLHYLTGRAEERLTFDVQPQLADRMGYRDHAGTTGVERFMKHYFLIAKDVGDLTRIFCAALEERHQRRSIFRMPALFHREIEEFEVNRGRLTVSSTTHFADHPKDMLRLFEVAQRHDLDIHPAALQMITRNLLRIDHDLRQDAEANEIFLKMLTSPKDPETTLRRLNEAGVFGRFVTDFGRVVAQMQYDMYHVYTTDEHTIRAIGILSRIERGELKEDHPLASDVVHKIANREVLYMAVLLHDIAKGRGGDHSVLGAEVAKKLCPRLGFTAEQTETVAWLVLYHLFMSDTSSKRDLGDPKTIIDFVDVVQSPERLRLLLCLTVVDIRAVGPGRWNNWKATLLRDLYARAEAVMTGGLAEDGRDAMAAAAVADLRAALADWPADEIENHVARGHAGYWTAYDADTLYRHSQFIRAAEQNSEPLALDTNIDMDKGATEVTIYAVDHPGLFSRIAGALAVSGANIVEAKITTLENGKALDSFLIQDAEGGAFSRSDKVARLSDLIDQSLSGELQTAEELNKRQFQPSRMRFFTVEPRVLIDNKASNRYTLIEVNGRDRPGLLFSVSRALYRLSLQVHSAKIATFGEQVVDVFYVQDVFGTKVDQAGKIAQVRDVLMEALKDPHCAPLDTTTDSKQGKNSAENVENRLKITEKSNFDTKPSKNTSISAAK